MTTALCLCEPLIYMVVGSIWSVGRKLAPNQADFCSPHFLELFHVADVQHSAIVAG